MSSQLPDLRSRVSARLQNFPTLDPRAVLAVGSREGLSGNVGDNGTSFGFAQLHQGGAYPASAPQNPQQAQAWANSPQGIDYALAGMSKVAGGLKGPAAVAAIVNQFERPADPKSEIQGALSAYDDPVTSQAKNLQQLKDTYGSWDMALAKIGSGEQAPAATSSAVDTFNAGAPSDTTVKILQSFGGIAAKAAKAGQDPIPLPSKLLGQLKGPNGPIDVRFDHNEALSPNTVPIVQAAEKYLGTPYLWGGSDPRKGFDCSGFVQYLYKQEGVDLPRTTYQQVKKGQPIQDPKDLAPGDILFFSSKGDVHHEGLYIGNNQFIHAPHTGDVVRISSLNEPYYKQQFLVGRRVIPQTGGGKA